MLKFFKSNILIFNKKKEFLSLIYWNGIYGLDFSESIVNSVNTFCTFIEIILATQSEINKSKIDSEWQLIVICAISVFENVCKNIHSGDITITELEHIKSNQIQMNRLCDAVSGTKSVPLASVTQASALRSSMAQRLKEFEYFKNYMTKLDHLVTHIGGILEGKWHLEI